MARTFDEFQAGLDEELKKPQREPRVDFGQMPDSHYEEIGVEIERYPIGLPRRGRPDKGPID